jgi:hypothetical protein
MLNRWGNRKYFAEAGRLPILACGRSIKNSVSVYRLCRLCVHVNGDLRVDVVSGGRGVGGLVLVDELHKTVM